MNLADRQFDAGLVRGYADRGRHLQADSCRALLTAEREVPADTWAAETRAVEAEFRNRHWNNQRERRVG